MDAPPIVVLLIVPAADTVAAPVMVKVVTVILLLQVIVPVETLNVPVPEIVLQLNVFAPQASAPVPLIATVPIVPGAAHAGVKVTPVLITILSPAPGNPPAEPPAHDPEVQEVLFADNVAVLAYVFDMLKLRSNIINSIELMFTYLFNVDLMLNFGVNISI